MAKHYIILSLKHSSKDEPVFWRPDNCGYTRIPWAAGIYTEEEVKEKAGYYNDGFNSCAIPLTDTAIKDCGLKFTLDIKQLKNFMTTNKL